MGVETNIPEVVKDAIEKAAMALLTSAREYGPVPTKAHRIISDITEHLTPAITTLIADVRQQDAAAVCPNLCGNRDNAPKKDPRWGWLHYDNRHCECPAGPIHDLKESR